MATITKGKTFTSGETVTPTKLNDLVDNATIAFVTADDTDDSTLEASAGKLRAKDAGITAAKLADGAVTGAAGGGKVAASAITGQTQLTDPLAAGDEFLVHDTSASALRRVAWSALQPAGSIIQTVRSTDALVGYQTIQGAKFIPFDDTVPESDEGEEVATVSITPQFSNSIIRINVSIPGVTFGTSSGYGIFAVFRGSATSAFASAFRYFASAGSYGGPVDFVVEDAPSTTSAITYRLRMGASFATSLKFGSGNTTGTQNLGNTVKMVMVASEIKA